MSWRNNGDPGQRRQRAFAVAIMVLVTVGLSVTSAIQEQGGHWRPVNIVQTGTLLFLATAIALGSTTRFSIRYRDPALNDELTMANRASAALWGFWALMLAIGVAMLINLRWPLPLQETLPVLIGIGSIIAGARFVMLERRGA